MNSFLLPRSPLIIFIYIWHCQNISEELRCKMTIAAVSPGFSGIRMICLSGCLAFPWFSIPGAGLPEMLHVAECRIVLAVPRHVLGRMGYCVLLININNQKYGINEIWAEFFLSFILRKYSQQSEGWKVAYFKIKSTFIRSFHCW